MENDTSNQLKNLRSHMIAWTLAVIVASFFYKPGGEAISIHSLADDFWANLHWWSPFLMLFIAGILTLGALIIAFIPACITTYIEQWYLRKSNKVQVIAILIGIIIYGIAICLFGGVV